MKEKNTQKGCIKVPKMAHFFCKKIAKNVEKNRVL